MKKDSPRTSMWHESPVHQKMALKVFLVLLVILGLVFGFMTYPFMLSLAAGAMLALLCSPLLGKMSEKKIYRKAAAILLTIGLVLLVIIPISIFVFLAIKQAVIVAQALLDNEDFSADKIFKEISNWEIFDRVFSAPKEGKRQIQAWLQDIGTMGVAGFISIVGEVPNVLLQLVLTIISFFYFLIDGPRFMSWIYDRIPFDSLARTKMERTFSDTTISVIWANLAASLVQAFIMWAAYFVLGVPAAFLATAATFVLAWIPILGSTPVWVFGAIFLFTQGSLVKVAFMLLFGLITGVADNIVRPLVLKGRANLHPLLSLVAIFGGISMFGILGVFIGPVIAAILTAFLQILPIMEQRAESLPMPK